MNTDNGHILSVKGLHITFDGQPFSTVRDLSFMLGRGKTLAVVGESGSGKSLTALSLMGLQPRNAQVTGDITLTLGRRPVNLANNTFLRTMRGKDVAMVFQEPMSALNPVMKVGKQLAEAILAHNTISKKAAIALAIDWLAKVQLPQPQLMYERYPHQLSGGQKQRVMIAMAMCNHPALLIADEPTTALDVTVQQEIIQLMSYLQQEHDTAMIFITHDLALAAQIADHVLVMYKGEMVEYGTAAQVLQQPAHPYTRALLASRPSQTHKGQVLPTVADILEGNTTTPAALPPIPPGNVLLDVQHLGVSFAQTGGGYYKAVDDVSFTIRKGEVLGLAGESGCGKSTISKAIVGLVHATDGSIMFRGKDLTSMLPRDRRDIRTGIQMIFQDPYSSLNPRMSIGDTLMEPLTIHNIVARHEVNKEAMRLLDIVQLPAAAMHKYPHEFSGGQRQRIGIARALSVRPELLICDESVSALDVSIQAQILNLLRSLQREYQLTYLFISHDLNVVHYISDRVMIMQAGKIVESGDASQVLEHPQHPYTQRLMAAMPDRHNGSGQP